MTVKELKIILVSGAFLKCFSIYIDSSYACHLFLLFLFYLLSILKRKSFANTHSNANLFLLFEPNDSLDDNAIDKSRCFPCIQHGNQNGLWLPSYNTNFKATPNLESRRVTIPYILC